MKRSEIDQAIVYAQKVLEQNHFRLPDLGYWKMEEWKKNQGELKTVFATMLGWDVTDFGSGTFEKIGSVLFNIRNGSLQDPSYGTPYAEKVIIIRHETEQCLPLHFHYSKTEDIINRGGGTLCIQLYGATKEKNLDTETPVEVWRDGLLYTATPGETIEIPVGASITLRPGQYHRFWAKKGDGDLVVGEVSSVNDDRIDNHFFEAGSRFSNIEEDAPAQFPLCNEYDMFTT